MAKKAERQAAILQIIGAKGVRSQEQLGRLLQLHGISVTQATLSRDIRELGLVKTRGASGLFGCRTRKLWNAPTAAW